MKGKMLPSYCRLNYSEKLNKIKWNVSKKQLYKFKQIRCVLWEYAILQWLMFSSWEGLLYLILEVYWQIVVLTIFLLNLRLMFFSCNAVQVLKMLHHKSGSTNPGASPTWTWTLMFYTRSRYSLTASVPCRDPAQRSTRETRYHTDVAIPGSWAS